MNGQYRKYEWYADFGSDKPIEGTNITELNIRAPYPNHPGYDRILYWYENGRVEVNYIGPRILQTILKKIAKGEKE